MGDSENLRGPDSSETLSTESLQLSKAFLGQLRQRGKAELPSGKIAMSLRPVTCSESGLMEKSQSGTGHACSQTEHQAPKSCLILNELGIQIHPVSSGYTTWQGGDHSWA